MQKAITPSIDCQYWSEDSGHKGMRSEAELTQSRNDLGLDAELVLESTCEIRNVAPFILRDVGHLSDVVEHMAAREEDNGDQGKRGPEVPVLDDGLYVVERSGNGGHDAQAEDGGDDDAHPVDGPMDRRVGPVGCKAREPRMDLVGGLRTRAALVPDFVNDGSTRFPTRW